MFPAGLPDRMPGLLPPYAPSTKKKVSGGPEQHESLNISNSELAEDSGLGAMTGLGVAMVFNAGLALAGLVGWEIWLMLH